MYLWKTLHSEESELIQRLYKSQELNSHHGGWVRLVQDDMNMLDTSLGLVDVCEFLEHSHFQKFRKINYYFPEDLRKIGSYFPEVLRKITCPNKYIS